MMGGLAQREDSIDMNTVLPSCRAAQGTCLQHLKGPIWPHFRLE